MGILTSARTKSQRFLLPLLFSPFLFPSAFSLLPLRFASLLQSQNQIPSLPRRRSSRGIFFFTNWFLHRRGGETCNLAGGGRCSVAAGDGSAAALPVAARGCRLTRVPTVRAARFSASGAPDRRIAGGLELRTRGCWRLRGGDAALFLLNFGGSYLGVPGSKDAELSGE